MRAGVLAGGLVGWWAGGLVGWWAGGLVGWWAGGLVGWWAGGLVFFHVDRLFGVFKVFFDFRFSAGHRLAACRQNGCPPHISLPAETTYH